MSTSDLPGLNRLLEVARQHDVYIETLPAGKSSPRAGERLYGMSVDPQLAAAFARFGKLVIGKLGAETGLLMRCDDEVNAFLQENKEWQGSFPHEFWPEHFRALMPFGRELRYRYATVPGLANPAGLQPVVQWNPYEELYALPIASTVDGFFETFSRYLEMVADDPDFREGGAPTFVFPHDVPELLAQDKPLVKMIKEGLFDRLMYERNKTGWRRETDIVSTRQWIDSILSVASE